MNAMPLVTQKSVATYYVVPICSTTSSGELPSPHAQLCNYYKYTPEGWIQKDQKQIVANAFSNFVCLVQLTDIADGPTPIGWTFESDVRLYGGVARTISGNDEGPITDFFLTNFTDPPQPAMTQPTMMIPVAPGCTRELILIFTVAGNNGISPGLRATFDPEIKGSTN